MYKPPVFIVGIGRSGTTLLRLMLNSHPNISVPYESHFITDYYHKQSDYGNLNIDDNLKKLLTDIFNEELLKQWDHEFIIEDIMPKIEQRELGSVFDAIYHDYAKARGKDRWGDKSDYLDRIHIINELFPHVKIIHIIRDGRDVANSVLKLPWGPGDIIQAAEWWHSHMTLGRKMGAMLNKSRYTEVTYESLVSDTENELKRLCEFIGEGYSEEMLNYHKKSADVIPDSRKSQHYNTDSAPKKDRIAAWKKEMTPTYISIFNHYADHTLRECGYEVPDLRINKFWLLLNRFYILFKRVYSS